MNNEHHEQGSQIKTETSRRRVAGVQMKGEGKRGRRVSSTTRKNQTRKPTSLKDQEGDQHNEDV
jgi:hypothetical protein